MLVEIINRLKSFYLHKSVCEECILVFENKTDLNILSYSICRKCNNMKRIDIEKYLSFFMILCMQYHKIFLINYVGKINNHCSILNLQHTIYILLRNKRMAKKEQ